MVVTHCIFEKDAIKNIKVQLDFLKDNVKLGIFVPIQGLDVLIFNRNDYKPHVFLTIGSICKEYEMKSV